MANLEGFDASTVEPTTDFEPLPAGQYLVMAIASEFKPTKKGGEYLEITHEVVDGEHRGRRLFDRLNLKNDNETAVKIAQASLSAICRAVGVLRPKDSAELHNKPLVAKVLLEERNDKPGAYTNRIKGYEAANTNGSSVARPVAASVASAAPQQQSLPPWKRKAS